MLIGILYFSEYTDFMDLGGARRCSEHTNRRKDSAKKNTVFARECQPEMGVRFWRAEEPKAEHVSPTKEG